MGDLLSKPKVPKPVAMPDPDGAEAEAARREALRRAKAAAGMGRDDTVLSGTKLGQY